MPLSEKIQQKINKSDSEFAEKQRLFLCIWMNISGYPKKAIDKSGKIWYNLMYI